MTRIGVPDPAGGVHAVPQGNVMPGAPMVVIPPPDAAGVQPERGCDCTIPPGAGKEVKMTRIFAIAIIVVHVLALAILGFGNFGQWVASLCGIIAGGVLLCCYTKHIYTCSSIVFIVAAVFDLVAAIIWVLSVPVLVILPIIAIGVTIPGIICGFMACRSWDVSSGLTGVQPTAVVTVQEGGPAVVMEMPQGNVQV